MEIMNESSTNSATGQLCGVNNLEIGNDNLAALASFFEAEPEPPSPIKLFSEPTLEMIDAGECQLELARELSTSKGANPRAIWRDISYFLAAAELNLHGSLSVDPKGENWEPTRAENEMLLGFVRENIKNWPDFPGLLDHACNDAKCILFQTKFALFLDQRRAQVHRRSKSGSKKEKDTRAEIFRLIDSKLQSVTKTTPQIELDARIRKLCDAGLRDDLMAQAYLAEKIVEVSALGKIQVRKIVQKVVSETRTKLRFDQSSGGNIVGQDDFKDLVSYARKQIEEENKHSPKLFRYGTEHGRILHVPEEGTVSVGILNKDGLRAAANECCDFRRMNDNGETRGISAPADVVSDLAQEQLPVPYLRQVSNYPQFDGSGKLLAANGYHESAFLFMHLPSDLNMAGVSAAPTEAERQEAIRLLIEEWLADFPFDGYCRREILVACGIEPASAGETKRPVPPSLLSFLAFVLQPLVRPIIGKSPMPALLISKPEAGTGATLLVNTAQNIVHGTTSTRTIPKDEDERRKEVFTALRGGDPFLFLDNVTGNVDSPVLAALLTSVTFTGRILGKSEEASIPNSTSVIITGNNPRFTRELQRRLSLCRLDAGVAVPEMRKPEGGWRHADIGEWVMQNRGDLLWALCTLVMNWQAMQRPNPKGTPLGSYRAWFEVCGGILDGAGLEGFQSNRDQIERVAGADDDDPMRDLITQWYVEATKRGGVLGLSGQFVKGDTGIAAFCDAREIDLPVARHMVDGERVYKHSALGQYLGTQSERVFDVDDGVSVRIVSGKKGKHGKPWNLVVT